MPAAGWRGGRGRGHSTPARRFMEPCLLLLVARHPAHGYELSQGLAEMGMPGIAPSLVYRMLRQLEMDSRVVSSWDTESGNGPARRVYSITLGGKLLLQVWVAQLKETDRVLHGFLRAYEEL